MFHQWQNSKIGAGRWIIQLMIIFISLLILPIHFAEAANGFGRERNLNSGSPLRGSSLRGTPLTSSTISNNRYGGFSRPTRVSRRGVTSSRYIRADRSEIIKFLSKRYTRGRRVTRSRRVVRRLRRGETGF